MKSFPEERIERFLEQFPQLFATGRGDEHTHFSRAMSAWATS